MKQNHRRPYLGPEYHKPQKGTCRWCAEPILDKDGKPNKRRTWHTPCAEAYLIATDSNRQRRAVWERDMGICAACGQCAVAKARYSRDMKEFLKGLWTLENGRWPPRTIPQTEWIRRRMREVDAVMKARGIPPEPPGSSWQADHRVPLCEANGDRRYFTMDNLQTLCHACHAAKTAADTARLRASRKPPEPPEPKAPEQPDLFTTNQPENHHP